MQEFLDFEQEQLPERVFLGWDAPLLESLTRWLLADENRSELASTMVVVPTSNSGRRLRMALSEGGGVLAPHVFAPSRLFEVNGVASRQESLWAWVQVIRGLELNEYPHLFRNHDSATKAGFNVALALARQFITLRDTLADADSSFRDAGYHSPEKERWAELGKLESMMLQQLGKWGLRDCVLAKREQAKSPELPAGVTRIVVAAVPEPTSLALAALQALLSKGLAVTVLIHAPETEKELFDHWGVPHAELWTARKIDIPDWQQRLHLVDSPAEAANACLRVLSDQQSSADEAALVLCDPSFEPALDKAFTGVQWPLYNPEGSSIADSGIITMLCAMRDLTNRERPFEALQQLVRLPGAEMFLPAKTSRRSAAKQMDKLHLKHLPDTLSDAEFLASEQQRNILKSVSSHLDKLDQNKLSNNLSKTLRDWLGSWLEQSDQDVAKAAEVGLAEAVDALQRLEDNGEVLSSEEAFQMLAESVQSTRVSSERGATVIDLQGWLEISYDPAPHLILAGMHEECVPDGAADDAFLPDSLRLDLGLRTMQARFARDAFVFEAALRSRADHGRVDAVVARFNHAGETRKPSRLLMRQSGESLAAVVRHLFSEASPETSAQGEWKRDWELDVPELENPYRPDSQRCLSPTAIRDYLDCPFRFFLKRILKMRTYDAGKGEMDAMDFGSLCHAVLENFGADEGIRDSVDAGEIELYFMEQLDAKMSRLYGGNLSLPLIVQLESARERLRALAAIQAADRANGWRIVETEFQVGPEDTEWQIAGHPIKMMIDRIDCHEGGSRWRVWDYKTSGKAKKPEDMHQQLWKELENRPLLGELIPAQGNKKERRWADVQLPIYAAFVQQHFNTGELPQIGYINLPRAVSDVAFSPWRNFDQSVLDHAMSWAEAAVEKIRAGEFSQAANYPANQRDWDDFAELAPDGLAKAFGLS